MKEHIKSLINYQLIIWCKNDYNLSSIYLEIFFKYAMPITSSFFGYSDFEYSVLN